MTDQITRKQRMSRKKLNDRGFAIPKGAKIDHERFKKDHPNFFKKSKPYHLRIKRDWETGIVESKYLKPSGFGLKVKDPTDFLTLLTALAVGVALATIIHSYAFINLYNICK